VDRQNHKMKTAHSYSHSVFESPIFERAGDYSIAIVALEVLLFGYSKIRESPEITFPEVNSVTRLSPVLLSRRARGKAFDRLLIDYIHLHRRDMVNIEGKAAKRLLFEAFQSRLKTFCENIISSVAQKSSVGFSAIRAVARRLKRPLKESLNCFCLEAQELGIRFANENTEVESDEKYSDWSPITDRSVANALSAENDSRGTRCAFVGFEDDIDPVQTTSLNVEQLAMEFYRSGRLPLDNMYQLSDVKGGWSGFHDEGEQLLVLVRGTSSTMSLNLFCRGPFKSTIPNSLFRSSSRYGLGLFF
jgi:hypothetical protein